MKEITDEKSCGNCRWFSQHYSKQLLKFNSVNCGFCIHEKNIRKEKRNLHGSCELWENIAIKKEERKKSVKEVLRDISEKLKEIAAVLKDDAETD